jgi:hypothetical protein
MTATELAEHKAGAHGRDYRLSDDGYGDMEVAEKRGWRSLASWGRDGWNLGDWPYVMIYTREAGGAFELQQVVEGDHDLYRFQTPEDRDAAIDYLFLWYAAGQNWAPLSYEDRTALDAGQYEAEDKFRGPYRQDS